MTCAPVKSALRELTQWCTDGLHDGLLDAAVEAGFERSEASALAKAGTNDEVAETIALVVAAELFTMSDNERPGWLKRLRASIASELGTTINASGTLVEHP